MARLTVTGAGGVRLAVHTEGDPAAPTVLLVHGYPDTHVVWDPVAERLAASFHVVRYDVRGAGESDAPRGLRAYRLPVLADDLFAVIAATSPDRPVHVVAHDWGSVQAWEAVTDPRATGRIAGFTTVSGPCLDHVGHWFRHRVQHPTRRGIGQVLGQMLHSWYIHAFHVPGYPTLLWRYLGPRWHQLRDRGTGPAPSPTIRSDGIRGVRLYRANVYPRLLRPRRRTAHVPVQLIVLARDAFVTPALVEDTGRWAADLRWDTMESEHFQALHAHAARFTQLLTEFSSVCSSPS